MRAGTGTGARLAEGEWDDARELPAPEPPKPPRRSKHRPAERLAALMSGRDAILACEELTLRARGDLRLGRDREAALQLEAALSAAVAELAGWVTHGDLAERLEELAVARPGGRATRPRRRARGGWNRPRSRRSRRRWRGSRRRCARGRCYAAE